MEKKVLRYVIKGMNKDLSISKVNEQYSYDNRNIRISVDNGENLYSITNEKGPEALELPLKGDVIGVQECEDSAIIFTVEGEASRIYQFDGDTLTTLVESTALNFNIDYPIESVYNAENTLIRKVYWTDNLNQPRMIILPSEKYSIDYNNRLQEDPSFFDFSGDMSLSETIEVVKEDSGKGMFPAGTIQYCFNYYNTYGKETHVADITPIYYLTEYNRGGGGEDKTSHSFNIKIKNVDTNYENIRVYSIIRTSEEGEPIVAIVYDSVISGNTVEFSDYNISNIPVDKYYLYFIGSKNIIANTIETKDNTLFIGNFSNNNRLPDKNLRDKIVEYYKGDNLEWEYAKDSTSYTNEVPTQFEEGDFSYTPNFNISKFDITNFKTGEHYIIGCQFQYNNGEYSSPIFIRDLVCTLPTRTNNTDKVILELKPLPDAIITELKKLNIKRVRPLIVDASQSSKSFIAQGVLNPTVYNVGDRMDNSPFAQSSWFFRPTFLEYNTIVNNSIKELGVAEFRERVLPSNDELNGEIANTEIHSDLVRRGNIPKGHTRYYHNLYAVDYSVFTMNTPEDLSHYDLSNAKLRIVGVVPIHNTSLDFKVKVDSNTYIDDESQRNKLKREYGSGVATGSSLLTDNAVGSKYDVKGKTMLGFSNYEDYVRAFGEVNLMIYPFHPTGSITNTKVNDTWASVLEENARYSYKYSKDVILFPNPIEIDINTPAYVDSEENKNYLLKYYNGHEYTNIIYRGYSDKIITGGGFNGDYDKGSDSEYHLTGVFVRNNTIATDPIYLGATLAPRIHRFLDIFDIIALNGYKYKIHRGIQVGYKSAKHVVISGKNNNGIVGKLPAIKPSDIPEAETLLEKYKDTPWITDFFKNSSLDINISDIVADTIINTVVRNPDVLKNIANIPADLLEKSNANNALLSSTVGEISAIKSKYKEGEQYSEEDNNKLSTLEQKKEELLLEKEEYKKKIQQASDYTMEEIKDSMWSQPEIEEFSRALSDNLRKSIEYKLPVVLSSQFDVEGTLKGANILEAFANFVGGTLFGFLDGILKGNKEKKLKSVLRNMNDFMSTMYKKNLLHLGIKEGTPEYDKEMKFVKELLIPEEAIEAVDTEGEIKWMKIGTLMTAGAVTGPIGLAGAVLLSIFTAIFDQDTYVNTHSLQAITAWALNINNLMKDKEAYNKSVGEVTNRFYLKKSVKYIEDISLPEEVLSKLTYGDKYYPFLLLGELYREVSLVTSENEVTNLDWIIAGKAAPLENSIVYIQGDVYKERYDAIKTMPIDGCKNKITEALSFMAETRIPYRFRYDRNKENLNYYALTTENTNKLNPVYENKDNYFKYNIIPDKNTIYNFNSSISWSYPKTNNEIIDSFSKMNLSNVYNLEYSHGKVNKIIMFNDNIFSFQDSGIGIIPYNSRVQVTPSDGVPIELAYSSKVENVRYISREVGCKNKHSIISSMYGIYFVDDNKNTLYTYSNNLTPLSDVKGFKDYVTNNVNKGTWIPYSNAFKAYQDKSNNRIYFSNSSEWLCYNETLQEFESYFDYTNTTSMFNIGSTLYSTNNTDKIWKHNYGEYNTLYGKIAPFKVEYRVNPNDVYNKIFSNIEFRADSYKNEVLQDKVSFAKLEVYNEYQYGINKLEYNKYKNSNLKKKFRLWRADIPREQNSMNRIKNTWCNVALTSEEDTNRTVLHDVNIIYYI